MSNELSTKKTMTVNEVSFILKKDPSTIRKIGKTLFPDLFKNGIRTTLSEAHVTAIKLHLGKNSQLPKTALEKELLIQQAMIFQQEKIQSLEIINSSQAKKIEKDKPKVEFYNTVADSRDCFEMSKVAKLIKKDIGRNQLFDFLRNERILRKDNEPYQKYINTGWFIIVEQEYKKPNGTANVNLKTLVTQKGIDAILKRLELRQIK